MAINKIGRIGNSIQVVVYYNYFGDDVSESIAILNNLRNLYVVLDDVDFSASQLIKHFFEVAKEQDPGSKILEIDISKVIFLDDPKESLKINFTIFSPMLNEVYSFTEETHLDSQKY